MNLAASVKGVNAVDSMVGVFGTVPLILAVALFIGVVILVRILLSPEGAFERRARSDRRRSQAMPVLPFYDSNRILVTEDRRRNRDRRKRRFAIFNEQKQI